MSYATEHVRDQRRVPAWPRRWLILLRLHDYLLGDAPVLFGLWLRSRSAFWQYVMKVEESRRVRDAVLRGAACWSRRQVKVPGRGAWRIG